MGSLRQNQKWKNFLTSAFRRTFSTASSTSSSTPYKIHFLRGFSDIRLPDRVTNTIKSEIASYEKEHALNLQSTKFRSGAFYLLDLQEVNRTLNLWRHTFPTIKPFFAMKANPQIDILKFFAKQPDTGFDCASQGEIEQVLSLNVAPERIIFAHPVKQMSHMDFAYRNGILKTVFDSECEAFKLAQIGTNWKLFLRAGVDDTLSRCRLSQKYGASFEECLRLFQVTQNLGLKVEGLHFHAGSSAHPDTYIEAFQTIEKLIRHAPQYGHTIRTVDTGGGYEKEILTKIHSNIQQYINDWCSKDIQFISEPGRLLVADAQSLVVKVIGKKVRGGKQMIFINDGMYKSFSNILYDKSKLLDEPNGQPLYAAGQSCDGLDIIECKLPDINVFDWLVFPGFGAYSSSSQSRFNGFLHHETVTLT